MIDARQVSIFFFEMEWGFPYYRPTGPSSAFDFIPGAWSRDTESRLFCQMSKIVYFRGHGFSNTDEILYVDRGRWVVPRPRYHMSESLSLDSEFIVLRCIRLDPPLLNAPKRALFFSSGSMLKNLFFWYCSQIWTNLAWKRSDQARVSICAPNLCSLYAWASGYGVFSGPFWYLQFSGHLRTEIVWMTESGFIRSIIL